MLKSLSSLETVGQIEPDPTIFRQAMAGTVAASLVQVIDIL